MCKVSIIVPVYKVEKYLAKAIDSLLAQTYRNIEILLIDDCSPDNSAAIMREYEAKDTRIRCFYQEQNAGVSATRNIGLDSFTGEWVCFCDGDDWYEPNYVEKMLGCAEDNNADYIICDYKIVSLTGSAIPAGSVSGLQTGCDKRKAIACGPLSSSIHMIHAELFKKSGLKYPTGCKQYEELPIIPVLAKYSKKIGIVNEPLYNYFQRGDTSSASNKATNYREDFMYCYGLMKEALGKDYEKELEYHAIYALLYGEILVLCKHKAKRSEIISKIKENMQLVPDSNKNPYISNLGKAKLMFLYAEKIHSVLALRAFALLHNLLIH